MTKRTILCVTMLMTLAGCERSQPQVKNETAKEMRQPTPARATQRPAPPEGVHILTPVEHVAMVLGEAIEAYDVPKHIGGRLLREMGIDPNGIVSSRAFNEFAAFVESSHTQWHQEHGEEDTNEARRLDMINHDLKGVREGQTIGVRRNSDPNNLVFPPAYAKLIDEFRRQKGLSDANDRIMAGGRVRLPTIPKSQEAAFHEFMRQKALSDPNSRVCPLPATQPPGQQSGPE
jgi:hypothetical protein